MGIGKPLNLTVEYKYANYAAWQKVIAALGQKMVKQDQENQE